MDEMVGWIGRQMKGPKKSPKGLVGGVGDLRGNLKVQSFQVFRAVWDIVGHAFPMSCVAAEFMAAGQRNVSLLYKMTLRRAASAPV